MDKFWIKALSVTGPVAVIGLILTIFIQKVFQEPVIRIFGDQNFFYLVMGILCLIAIALILSLLVYRRPSQKPLKTKKIQHRTANIANSKIEGDIVFGDKIAHKDKDNE